MKIGILGAGNIAHTMAKTISKIEDSEVFGIGARDKKRADEFASKFNITHSYGSYEELLDNQEIELIYIATPHSHHYEQIKLCLEYGKHVLCEKAFTINEKEAREVFQIAQDKNLLVTEAMWTRYMPSRDIINQVIDQGKIGEIKTLTANLAYLIGDKDRIIKPELAGGALLDIGIYTINFALMHFGKDITKITSTAMLMDSGVDGQHNINILYKDGKMAVLNSSVYGLSDGCGTFYGTKGYMEVQNINNPTEIRIYDMQKNLIERIEIPNQITGYEYEVIETIKSIKLGKKQCPSMLHEESLFVLEIMDSLRKEWGVKYPRENCK